MALARNLRTLIVLGTVASLIVTGAIWAHQAMAQDAPECPPDWPNQQYAGPLREKDHGRIQYQDYHTDSDGERWFVIRASDSNGYTTIRAYPASDDADGGYYADSPDQVCYLIVRKPGQTEDAAEPEQVEFPREREPQRTVESISSVIPTLAPTPTPQVVPDSPPELSSLELDGEVINSRDIVRSGLSRGQEVQIILRISDADGGLVYLALVAEDGAVLDRVDCENGVAQECTLSSTVTAPSTYSATLRFRAVAVDDAGGETEVAAFSLTTEARPRSPTTPSRPVPRLPTTVSEQHTAGAEAIVEHSDGVQVQIPEAATAGTPSDEHSWTPGSAITEEPDDGNDRMVTVSIQAIDPPEGNVLEGGQVYNISFTDDDGDDVHLRQPVTLTLPYTLPDDKTASDVVVLHWDQRVRRWESADGGMVDEAAQTISVELQDFSPVRVSFYMTPLEFLSTAMLSFVGADLFQAQYDDGFKHTASIRGEVQFPLPFITFLGAKIGGTLILDLDDILSLVNESKQYTVEGEEGFFTYGLNLHLAITEPDLKVSTALKFPILDVGRPAGSRYNHDVTFEGSISALSIGVEGLDLSLLTVNENGNIEPVAAQLETCMACILNLVYDPHAIDIEAGDTTINVAKGEFNTNFEEILDNLEDECLASKCEITFSEFIGLYLEWFTGGPLARAIAAYQAGQSIGLLHQYTSYEHIRPDLGASIGLGYSNGIEKTTGGRDVNGDGTADLVFPPEQPGGTPLQIWTTGDNLEDRRYFLELYELTEGWDIQVDTAKWHADLNPAVGEASEDALLRVDFETQALSTNETHWLVTTEADAPNLGHASFRLVHERALLEGGTDVLVDDVDLPLVKDKPFSDLSAQATVTPDRVGRGETLTYTVSLENRGPDPAENIELHLRSPVQHALLLTNASSSAGGPPSCQESDHFRGQICTLSNLADDESADVSLDFELRETLPHGETLRMSFVVVSDTEELAPGDNSASADTTIRASDRGALVALYNATSGAGWSSNDNWLTDEPLGEWHGVNTDANGRVTELYLANNQLIGPIPAELGHLTGLRWLNLAQNQLTGELPAEWAGMTELEWLYLWDNQLTGSAPSWLGDLSSLVRLELSENGFTGAIPGNLGSLPRLELLMLNDNDLTGTIPVSLGSATALRWLSLSRNQLLGQIPSALGNLRNLQYLHLSGNAFTGCLPIGLQNVTDNDFDVLVSAGVAVCAGIQTDRGALTALYHATGGPSWINDANWLSDAPLSEWAGVTTDGDARVTGLYLGLNRLTGEIPEELGQLTNLTYLDLNRNGLTGEIPEELGQLTNLTYLDLNRNRLTGEIPEELGQLTNLTELSLGDNRLTGEIPEELGQLTNLTHLLLGTNDLTVLSLGTNELTGEIPEELGQLTNLTVLELNVNELTGEIPEELGQLTNLTELWLSHNGLTGEIPEELGQLTNLTQLWLRYNGLTGEIPEELGQLTNLTELWLGSNELTGEIPEELGQLTNLTRLSLGTNELTGEIPEELGQLTNLTQLWLGYNGLTGEIPEELGQLTNLTHLWLASNGLTGEIPEELGQLTNLRSLWLGSNELTGEIPEELGQLTNVREMSLASNGLTGEIPEELGQLTTNLVSLDLARNGLTGEIPEELGQLTNLRSLRLYGNGLTGEIPEELGNLEQLVTLQLFLNDFTGCIPTGLRYVQSILLGLPFCDETGSAPVITSDYSFTVPEGTTAVGTLTATDQDTAGNLLVWTLDGDLAAFGPDREHFTITAAGQLAFAAAKDYENPDDADNDGTYLVVVRVSDGTYFDDNIIKVTLTDVTD